MIFRKFMVLLIVLHDLLRFFRLCTFQIRFLLFALRICKFRLLVIPCRLHLCLLFLSRQLLFNLLDNAFLLFRSLLCLRAFLRFREFRHKLLDRFLLLRMLFHLSLMPSQKFRDNLKISLQITLHRGNQSQINLTVFYNVYARFFRFTLHRIHRIFQMLRNLTFRTEWSHRTDIWICIRISCAENLIKHQCHRITDPFRCSRKYHFHHQFIAI